MSLKRARNKMSIEKYRVKISIVHMQQVFCVKVAQVNARVSSDQWHNKPVMELLVYDFFFVEYADYVLCRIQNDIMKANTLHRGHQLSGKALSVRIYLLQGS